MELSPTMIAFTTDGRLSLGLCAAVRHVRKHHDKICVYMDNLSLTPDWELKERIGAKLNTHMTVDEILRIDVRHTLTLRNYAGMVCVSGILKRGESTCCWRILSVGIQMHVDAFDKLRMPIRSINGQTQIADKAVLHINKLGAPDEFDLLWDIFKAKDNKEWETLQMSMGTPSETYLGKRTKWNPMMLMRMLYPSH